MLLFALISEIPFNLLYGGQIFYPVHQNVLWTFLLALVGLRIMEHTRKKYKLFLTVIVCCAVCLFGAILGYLLFVDYYGAGVLTVFVFYFFDRDRKDSIVSSVIKDSPRKKFLHSILCFSAQLVCLYYINSEMLGGYYFTINLFVFVIEIVRQSFALLALIPIWLYNGKQGYHRKWFKYFCYSFYPLHCLILALIAIYS